MRLLLQLSCILVLWQGIKCSPVKISDDKMIFLDAVNYCYRNDMRLTKVLSAADNTEVNNYLMANGLNEVWINANDLHAQGKFVDDDNNVLSFTKFAKGHPSNGQDYIDCVSVKTDGLWYDNNCKSMFKAICSPRSTVVNPENVEPPPPPPPNNGDNEIVPTFKPKTLAPVEQKPSNKPPPPPPVVSTKTEYSFDGAQMNWDDGNAYCQGQGMKMVKIFTKETNDAVYAFAKAHGINYYYWINFNDREVEFDFFTNDKEPMQYKNFDVSERHQPDDLNGNEKCVHVYNTVSTWNDLPCEEKLFIICERVITVTQ